MLSLHYNGSNSFLNVNAVRVYQFKAKESEMKPYCFGNISKDFTIDDMKKKGVSKSSFFVDYNAIDTSDILDINRFLMNER